MEAQNKADELIEKFIQYTPAEREFEYPCAVKCAIVLVDEIINVAQYKSHLGEGHPEIETCEFWQEVKAILQNL